MHWFWRALTALLGGALVALFGWVLLGVLFHQTGSSMRVVMCGMLSVFLLEPVATLFFYRWLSRRCPPGPTSELRAADETHCRACDHILRGLIEPRCPECGERI